MRKSLGIYEEGRHEYKRKGRYAIRKMGAKKGYGDLFVEDGAPCPEMFEKEEIKITFVLKEANDMEKEAYEAKELTRDMRRWIDYYGGCSATWNNITRWTQAILDNGEDYSDDLSPEGRIHWLKRISFLNLKKISGDSSSDPVEIKRYAEEDGKLIHKQLSIYQPDIIVCCGIDLVADCLGDYVFHYEGEWMHDSEAYKSCCWFYTESLGKTTAVLNCYHPLNLGTGCTNKELFDAITKIAPKILEGRYHL